MANHIGTRDRPPLPNIAVSRRAVAIEAPFTARRHRQNRGKAASRAGLVHAKGVATVRILITTDYLVPGDDNAAAALP